MSKKADAALDKFLADCLAAVPEDKRAVAEELFKADGVKTKLREGVLAREDYSRQSDELKASREALEAETAKAQDLIKKNTDWYHTANAEYTGVKAKLDRYAAEFGDLEGEGKPAKKFLSEDDFNKRLDEALSPRDAAAIDVADILTDLKIEHRDKFKEKLDTKALIKFATENRMPLTAAYTAFVADKVEAVRKTEFDDAIKKAREEGAAEARASQGLPIIARSSEPFSFAAPADIPRSQADRVKAAALDFSQRASA